MLLEMQFTELTKVLSECSAMQVMQDADELSAMQMMQSDGKLKLI